MKLACKELNPAINCSFEARGNTAAEVAKKMMTHVKLQHPDEVKGKTDDEMMAMFEAKAHA